MNKALAQKLFNMLWKACPYDSGNLQKSIQIVPLNEKDWVVIIGTEGDNQIGKSSIEYAHITNDYPLIGWSKKEQRFTTPNRNYHWVNKVLKKWAEENMLQFQLEGEDNE